MNKLIIALMLSVAALSANAASSDFTLIKGSGGTYVGPKAKEISKNTYKIALWDEETSQLLFQVTKCSGTHPYAYYMITKSGHETSEKVIIPNTVAHAAGLKACSFAK